MAKGYRVFEGKRFTLHSRAGTKRFAEKIKKEMKRDGWNVRITKTKQYPHIKDVFPYLIWIRRKK